MTDDCCFGEEYDEADEGGTECILVTLEGYRRDKESLARLESIADRLAVAAMALAGVIADKNKSILDIEPELRDAQDAMADLERYGEERAERVGFAWERGSEAEPDR